MKTVLSSGKCSIFGDMADLGVAANEGLSLIEPVDLAHWWYNRLFIAEQPPGTTGLARRLNPSAFYCAMRWDFAVTPREAIRNSMCLVQANGVKIWCSPADWGPNERTGRIIDLSPGAAEALMVKTDEVVAVTLIMP